MSKRRKKVFIPIEEERTIFIDNIEIKSGDRVIYDSGYGYELGYFIDVSDNFVYNTCLIKIITGIVTGNMNISKSQLKPYDLLTHNKLLIKYGTPKEFPELIISTITKKEKDSKDLDNIINKYLPTK